jgi:hypothetical protein
MRDDRCRRPLFYALGPVQSKDLNPGSRVAGKGEVGEREPLELLLALGRVNAARFQVPICVRIRTTPRCYLLRESTTTELYGPSVVSGLC